MADEKTSKMKTYVNKLDTIPLLDTQEHKGNDTGHNCKEHKGTEHSNEHLNYIFKVIIVGDTNTGKTTICNTLMERSNQTMQYQPTIGIDFNTVTKQIYTNVKIKTQLWDTAGQEKYRSIITSYFRNICAAIITYDITNRSSFTRVTNWITDLNRFNTCRHKYQHPFLLLGTKADIKNRRQIQYKEAYNFAENNGLIFREINSFKLNGPLETGFMELLQTTYHEIERERNAYIENIPIAEPYNDNLETDNLTIHLEPMRAKIEREPHVCKGVKNMFEMNKVIKNNKISTHDESPTMCTKCIIC